MVLFFFLGDNGFVNLVLTGLGLHRAHTIGTDLAVVVGLLHLLIPLATFNMVTPIKNIDPNLEQASQFLGAGSVRTFWRITLPLSLPGLGAAWSICLAWGLAAFITPTILGAGIVKMMSTLVYSRFSEIANYPLGATVAMILFAASLTLTYVSNRVIASRIKVV